MLCGLLLHFPERDSLRIDVGDVKIVLGQDFSLKRRVRHEPRVLDHPAVAAEIGGLRVVAPLLRPKLDGLGPGGPGELLERCAVARLIGHRGVESLDTVHQ